MRSRLVMLPGVSVCVQESDRERENMFVRERAIERERVCVRETESEREHEVTSGDGARCVRERAR
jgi:hypothetical protein